MSVFSRAVGRGKGPIITPATGTGAINKTTSMNKKFRLVVITLKLSSAPTTSEDLEVTLDAKDGSAYDTVLFSTDPSVTSATSIVFIPDEDLTFEKGDEIKVTYTNTDGNTYGLRIVTE